MEGERAGEYDAPFNFPCSAEKCEVSGPPADLIITILTRVFQSTIYQNTILNIEQVLFLSPLREADTSRTPSRLMTALLVLP